MATKEEILSTFNSKEGAWWAYNEGIRIGYNEAFNSLKNQAAIAAMQGVMNCSIDYNKETIARLAVEQADALIDKHFFELGMSVNNKAQKGFLYNVTNLCFCFMNFAVNSHKKYCTIYVIGVL